MNTIVHQYPVAVEEFQFSHHAIPNFLEENFNNNFDGFPVSTKGSPSPPADESSSEGESSTEIDHSDAMLRFINHMLMEEVDLENKPCMLLDSLALQATEKSLYDVLNYDVGENPGSQSENFTKSTSNCVSARSSDATSFIESNWNKLDSQSFFGSSKRIISHGVFTMDGPLLNQYSVSNSSSGNSDRKLIGDDFVSHSSETKDDCTEIVGRDELDISPNSSKEKKNRGRGDGDCLEEHRSRKQVADDLGEVEPLEIYDNVLLCSNTDNPLMPSHDEVKKSESTKKSRKKDKSKESNKGNPKGGRKRGGAKEVVDLRGLLIQCAQAVASFDIRTFNDLLIRIRQHSSPLGDGSERLAHYFADALEARVAGTGTERYAAISSRRISAAMILKAYKTFITACPYRKISNLFANKTIKKLATKATRIHIIDFGILYGFQWPCLIQSLSERTEGPPNLRITGIDFPQTGFRPAERVKDTGHRLAEYCERFNVPFEFTAIAQKWETITLEDLRIDKNELLVVNSLYRLQNVPDETVIVNSPRDVVLDLIRKINPDLFIHGIINGTFNTPFFITRFRETLFHFSSMFDMFEATIAQEDPERLLFEEHIFGKEIMNIVACEGSERVERPETYKQWQARNVRAGLRQLPLDPEIVKHVKNKVKREYHKDFSVDEDGKWMLQGWKGRVIHGLSYWIPTSK
ncbi:scarecrow-like protein 33-like [Dorcoceras hygrometricum]|uniref:Scarecrow-like protein 33-like n=1 Tax=Dorcoceras hygrometricum TaxID=472368 RepID=A0A2Z7B5G1_9LAMI|nr:scarecrow-like protein 33-like [Dorcoceras hygrometricum]